MQSAAGGVTSARSDGQNDSYRSIISDLVSLIERVQESMKLIESTITTESPSANQELAASILSLTTSPRATPGRMRN